MWLSEMHTKLELRPLCEVFLISKEEGEINNGRIEFYVHDFYFQKASRPFLFEDGSKDVTVMISFYDGRYFATYHVDSDKLQRHKSRYVGRQHNNSLSLSRELPVCIHLCTK